MSGRPLTDVEVSRALNALVTTLNDRGARVVDRATWQRIVTGSLGGEERIEVAVDPLQHDRTVRLRDAGAGRVLATVRLVGGRWLATREGAPLSGGHLPHA